MFNRGDYEKLVSERKGVVKPADRAKLEDIARAAPEMTVLTGTTEWDKYLTYLQAMLEYIERKIEYTRKSLLDPNVWGIEELTVIKMDLLKFEDRKELLEFVMELPQELVESGKIAKQTLYDLNEE